VVIFHFEFWPQEAKKNLKIASRGSHENNKFYILDGIKHDSKKFSILHFKTPK
jgi:hypothetical protein